MRIVRWLLLSLILIALVPANAQNIGPVITSISLTQGPVYVGIVITGSNFGSYVSGTSSVTLNGMAEHVTSGSWNPGNNGQITAEILPGSTSGNIVVRSSAGTSNGVGFTVLPSYQCPTCLELRKGSPVVARATPTNRVDNTVVTTGKTETNP
jgi:hypothetical protein